MSDVDKIKVIDKLEVADSESDFGLHDKALVFEIFAFYLNKSDIHFAISSYISATNRHSPCIEFSCIMYFMYHGVRFHVCIVMYLKILMYFHVFLNTN